MGWDSVSPPWGLPEGLGHPPLHPVWAPGGAGSGPAVSCGVAQAPHWPGGRLQVSCIGGRAAGKELDGGGGEGGPGWESAPGLQTSGGGEWDTGTYRTRGHLDHGDTSGTGTLGAVDTGGTSGHVALRNLWDTGRHRDTWCEWHRKAQGGRGSVWMGTAILSQPTLSPRQVKKSLQNTAPYESPIAFEELEGSCRTSYGYNGAVTARRPPAALALALVLAPLLSVLL